MADAAGCADCGAVASLFPFYGPWVRDGRSQRGGLLCRACIERLSSPLRDDHAERVGSLAQGMKRWQRALTAWSDKQPARDAANAVRHLEADKPAQPPAPAVRRNGPKPKPLTIEQRDLVSRAQHYPSLHQAAKNLNIPRSTLRLWTLRYEREVRLGVEP